MLPMTTLFMVVSPILLITSITIFSIGIMYRIREQIITSIGIGLLGLGSLVAALGLNKIDETLMIDYGWRYPYVKLLEAGILNPIKGPISPTFIQIGAWLPATSYMIAANIMIVMGIIFLSYVGALMLGLEGPKALIIPVVVAVLGFAGIILMSNSINLMVNVQDIVASLKVRDQSAYLRALSLLIGFAVLTIGALSVFFETRTKEYLAYSMSYFLLAVAWSAFSVSFFTAFENKAVFQFITEGSIATPLQYFLVGAALTIAGSVGLLIASTIEVIGSALGGAELEEVELEEAEESEE